MKERESFRLIAYLSISALLSLSIWVLLLLPELLSSKGWSSQKIGWAIGIFFVVSLVAQIVSGSLADRFGNVPTALVGAAFAVFGSVCYLLGLWFPNLFFLARACHGAGYAMVTAGALFHLVQSVPAHLKGRMIGYFGLPGFVMLGAGPFLSELLKSLWGMELIFGFLILTFMVIAWVLRQLPRPLAPKGKRRVPFKAAFRSNFPQLKAILIFSFFFGFCFAAWQSFLAPTVAYLGAGAVSAFGLGYGGGAVMTRLGLSQRLESGMWRLGAVSTLCSYGLCLALIPYVVQAWQLGVVGLFCGMSHGIYYPALSAIATERFHPLYTGNAMSLYIASSSLGMFIGPPLWGVLADWTGYRLVFVTSGVVLILATMVFLSNEWGKRSPVAVDPRQSRASAASKVNNTEFSS